IRRPVPSFFVHARAPPGISTLSLHDALPISPTASDSGAVVATSRAPDSSVTASEPCTARVRRAPPELRTSTASSTVVPGSTAYRSEEHTSELQSRENLVCRLLLEKKKKERRS